MTKDQALERREELRSQLAEQQAVTNANNAEDRRIAEAEDPQSRRSGGGRPRPLATERALAKARVDAARGEVDAAEVERLERRKREIELGVALRLEQTRIAQEAKRAIEADIVQLHRERFAAFAEAAEEKVAELERIAAELLPLLDRYGEAWAAAVLAWREPCRDNGLVGPPRCPLPSSAQVRGQLPRPPQVEPVGEAEAA